VQNIVSTPSYAPGAPYMDQWNAPADALPAAPVGIPAATVDDERSSTITLTLEDISEIASRPPPAAAAPRAPMPPPPIRRKSPRFWQVLTIVLTAGLAVSFYFNLPFSRKTDDTWSAETGRSASARTGSSAPETAATGLPMPPEDHPAGQEAGDTAGDGDTESPAPADEPAEAASSGRDEAPADKDEAGAAQKESAQGKPQATTSTSQKSTQRRKKRDGKSSSTTSKNAGTLKVTKPSDATGAIRVSVDGKLRGRAPLRVQLPPGLHEIVFSHNGKRTMRMVSIQTGQTKTIEAKVPQ